MKVSKEELLHIVQLADLKLKDEEIDNYLENLDEILGFAEVINKADVTALGGTIGVNENENVFRKDEIKIFENQNGLLENSPDQELNMFKIPKVIQ